MAAAGRQSIGVTAPGAAVILYDRSVDGPCNVFTIENDNAAGMVWVRVTPLHRGDFFPIPPGRNRSFRVGYDQRNPQGIDQVFCYTDTAGMMVNWAKQADYES